jgi:ABC-type thiamine transport system substrate-binding protein
MNFGIFVLSEILFAVALLGFNLVTARADWESTLAAAKKEGKVSVITDVTATLRDALTLEFQKKYGISVELLGSSGREVAPRVAAERKAGQFLWDIYIHGATTALEAMIPMGAFDPLEPAFILSDVKDPKTWRGGAIEFLDPNKMVLVMTPFHRGTIFYNPKLVNAKEFTSHKDLLNPKWRGKMVVDDLLLPSPRAWSGLHSRVRQTTDDDSKRLCAGGGCGRSRAISGACRCCRLCRDQ